MGEKMNKFEIAINKIDYLQSQNLLPLSWIKLKDNSYYLRKLEINNNKRSKSKPKSNQTLTYLTNINKSMMKAVPTRILMKNMSNKIKGPNTSLKIPSGLKEYWYPIEFSNRLLVNTLLPFELFEETWVLWRDKDGRPACVRDQCAHRACPLSLGKIKKGEIQCPYHGWQFNRQGSCTKIPSTKAFPNLHIRSLPVCEIGGLVWVWPGETVPKNDISLEVTEPPMRSRIHSELVLQVPVEHGLLLENLLDLAHAPFTHTSTFAKGWPVPDVVKFHANRVLGGCWDPYPIDMSFEPPCMVVSTIGLSQPGQIEKGAKAVECSRHLHQLHICLPSSNGKCRLLYRMSLDFLDWSKYLPGIQKLWKAVANKVLGEDLRLVVGQQNRLKYGANVWANPVSYDKLGVRYRRWRNSLSTSDQKTIIEKQLY